MRASLGQIVIDCRDPYSLVRFWAGLLGGHPVDRALDWSHLDPPGFPRLAFQPVPDEKLGKNRLHFDIEVADIPGAVTEALRVGARRLGPLVTDEQGSFQVLADPAGNEFCFVRSAASPAPGVTAESQGREDAGPSSRA